MSKFVHVSTKLYTILYENNNEMYFYLKMQPPPLNLFYPRKGWFEQTRMYTTYRSVYTSSSLSRRLVLGRRFLTGFLNYFFRCKNKSTPHCAPSYPGDHNLNNRESILPEDAFSQIKSFLVNWFWEELQRFLYKLCRNSIPIVSPP